MEPTAQIHITSESQPLLDKFGIYVIRGIHHNAEMLYIGSTRCSFRKRLYSHVKDLCQNKHTNYALQRDWNIYGGGSFSFSIIEVCPERHITWSRERFWINHYASLGKIYNIAGVDDKFDRNTVIFYHSSDGEVIALYAEREIDELGVIHEGSQQAVRWKLQGNAPEWVLKETWRRLRAAEMNQQNT